MHNQTDPQPLFLAEVVLFAGDWLDASAEELALALPEDFLKLAPYMPVAGLTLDRVVEAARLWERIIRDRWFDDDSGKIGEACMRMVLDPESELFWPGAVLKEIKRTGKALEAGGMEADPADWVGSWLAQAKAATDGARA